MQSIDQQAAASQTSGQPLSRNSRIQTPNSSTEHAAEVSTSQYMYARSSAQELTWEHSASGLQSWYIYMYSCSFLYIVLQYYV